MRPDPRQRTSCFKGTLLALKLGDAAYSARGLSYVGLMMTYEGGATSVRWGRKLIDDAERLARDHDEVAALGWVGTVRGMSRATVGEWRRGLDEIDEGVALLRKSSAPIGSRPSA